MWYFTWILGVGLAVTFAALNAMWYEGRLNDEEGDHGTSDSGY